MRKSDFETLIVRLRRTSNAARSSAKLAEDDRDARDSVIYEAEDAGMTAKQIAANTDLSEVHIGRILSRRATG